MATISPIATTPVVNPSSDVKITTDPVVPTVTPDPSLLPDPTVTPAIVSEPVKAEFIPDKSADTKDDPIVALLLNQPSLAVIQRMIGQLYFKGLKEDSNEMFKWLIRSAENNDPEAQYLLAMRYWDKYGRVDKEKDGHFYDSYFYWLEVSAKNGYAEAQYELGKSELYDDVNEFKWTTMAAQQGHVMAIYNLSNFWANADDDDEDEKKIQEYWTQSFKWAVIYVEKSLPHERYPDAHYALAHMYQQGKGTKKDNKKAFEHVNLCIDLVKKYDTDFRPDIEPYGETEEDRQKDKKIMCDNFKSQVYTMLGHMYFDGEGIEQDYKKAFQAYCDAQAFSEQEDLALYNMHIMYRDGKGVPVDEKNAELCLIKSAEACCEPALYQLAKNNLANPAVAKYWAQKDCPDKDYAELLIKRAIEHLKKCCEVEPIVLLGITRWKYNQDYENCAILWERIKSMTEKDERADVNYYFGIMFRDGLYVKKDYEKAIELFTISLSKTISPDEIKIATGDYKNVLKNFKYSLAEMKEDYPKAFLCCKTLAEHGNIVAQFSLSWLYWTGHGGEKSDTKAFQWYSTALVNDKTDELKEIRQELKSYENEMMVQKLTQISQDKKNENVDALKSELDASKKQITDLMEQMKKLTSTVGKIKEKQESAEVIFESDKDE